MKSRNLFIKILCVFIFLPTLSGCWDKKEIEKKAYVVAIGLDKGENENLVITYLIANPEFGTQQQGGSTNEPPHEIISFETNDLISSTNKANAVIAKEISYNLLKYLIVSEKLAKTKNFIRWMYDATKDKDFKRDTYLIVSKENASIFITNNSPKLETRAHRYFDFIIKRGIETATISDASLHKYLRITEADADLFLAIFGTTEKVDPPSGDDMSDNIFAGQLKVNGNTNKTQFIGSALFKEGKMIDQLTVEETRITRLLSSVDEAPDILTTLPDPFNKDFKISITITQLKNIKIKMDVNKQPTTIHVHLPLQVDVLSDHSMVNYASNADKRNELKKFLIERFNDKFNQFIKKTQEEYKSEPFGWSLHARRKFATIAEYEKFDWMKSYPGMDVQISIDIKFGHFGRQSRLPKLKDVRD
ncbi:Ger(x)C family germination protein [Cytobacillus eiseniae]|uniref:Ger(X)C family germination protein n=1 Tax=Cytobacillus eiseniae TaxID=762947 RepID=A0ABS4R9V2_9BACI|nr:Ger(x)C family spore germination C-terminal domain-containing protein [Cytobacillus eiseniae]MBP2239661.1 Ger(x)C family germination protein [Cytobacillus eiseniae]